MTASQKRTRITLRAWSMPVTIGIDTQRLASRASKPGRSPTTTPPAWAAPREAASITPPSPPHSSTAPASAMARPTPSASRATRREHWPSPITPRWRPARARFFTGTTPRSGSSSIHGLDPLPAALGERAQHRIQHELRAHAILERRRRTLAPLDAVEEALHQRSDGGLADDLHLVALSGRARQPRGHRHRLEGA